jgi:hypothetical protein
MAKRRTKRKAFVTAFPNHHEVIDAKSRALALRVGSVRNGFRLLSRMTNQLFRKFGEADFVFDIDGDVIPVEVHTVEDDRVEAAQIGKFGLRPVWHGTV